MPDGIDILPDESRDTTPIQPSSTPAYSKCITCPDLGQSCRGFDITCLDGIDEVRGYHKTLRKARGIPLKSIYGLAQKISESTINEYFGTGSKDFKWTTAATIHSALLLLCGNRVGLPPLEDSCPVSSSEARQQLAAADLNLAAANMNLATMQAECDDLRRRLADSDGSHISQIADIQAANRSEVEWLKNDIKLWRRFAFLLLGLGIIILGCLIFYVAWDVAHPSSGLFRY